MLSQDVVDIIDKISEKIETNNFESLTFEEIKSACFSVIIQIEHLKANNSFSIADNSKELTSYKRIIIHLVEWQAKFIELNKNTILGNYVADLTFLREMIHTIPEVLGVIHNDKGEKITFLVSRMLASINKLKYKLQEANCFDVALTVHNECSSELIFLYSNLLEMHHAERMRYSIVIKGYFEAMKEIFDFYLREITYFRDLEITNAKCLSYSVMDYIPKNVRH